MAGYLTGGGCVSRESHRNVQGKAAGRGVHCISGAHWLRRAHTGCNVFPDVPLYMASQTWHISSARQALTHIQL